MLDFDANRCAEAPAMLEALSARFPLRFVDGDSLAKPCTIEDLLNAAASPRSTCRASSRAEARG